MNADEKRKVFEELLERYQDYIESEFSYEDGEREAERKAWLNRYYGIKEPLIKDEKIRKAVRAWADAFNIDRVFYDAKMVRFYDRKSKFIISVGYPIIGIWDKKDGYTIDELCGEEEE